MIKVCVICHKTFYAFESEKQMITCGDDMCRDMLHRYPRSEWQHLMLEAAMLRRPAKVDCKCYRPLDHDCSGLNGLYCEWEDCKFYKPREGATAG